MADGNPWNAAEITLVRQLWAADWSAGSIAKQLKNRTRNGVIGFASRNRDICPMRGTGRRPAIALPRGARAAPKPRLPDTPKPPPPPPDNYSVPRPQSSAKADLYRMLRRAVLNTGGRP